MLVVDDLSTGRAELVAAEADLEVLDIVDAAALDPVINAAVPTAIYHLAAQASVTASVANPRRDCDVNVRGTLNLLEAARRCGAPLIFSSTGGALYGTRLQFRPPRALFPLRLHPTARLNGPPKPMGTPGQTPRRCRMPYCAFGNIYGPRQSPYGEAGVVAIFSHALWRRTRPRMIGV